MVPKLTINVNAEDLKNLRSLIKALEEHDDVQNVYTNADISDEDRGDATAGNPAKLLPKFPSRRGGNVKPKDEV